MRTPRRWRAKMSGLLLAAALLGEVGCLSFCHPIQPPEFERVQACSAVPFSCRSHVHIFLISGVDPVNFCNFEGVRHYLNKLGFTQTYNGELYNCIWFKYHIREVHKEDPTARIVLIGDGLGANVARSMAADLQKDGVIVNLLVYLDGNTLTDSRGAKPDNVERVVNVRTPGHLWEGPELSGAENVQLADTNHFAVATHPHALEVLEQELVQLAGTVPAPVVEPPPAATPEIGPTPRPVLPTLSTMRDEWDFLKPASKLSAQSPVRYAPPDVSASAPPSADVHTTLKPKSAP